MNEAEQKQWIVDRIETMMQLANEDILFEKEHLESLAEQNLTNMKEVRNNILAGIGIAITFLLAIAAISLFSDYVLLFLVIALVLAALGFATYFTFNLAYAGSVGLLRRLWTAHFLALNNIGQARSFVVGLTIAIDQLPVTNLETLTLFLSVAMTAQYSLLAVTYSEVMKARGFFLGHLHDHFELGFESSTNTFQAGYGQYKQYRQGFQAANEMLSPILHLIKPYEDEMVKEKPDGP